MAREAEFEAIRATLAAGGAPARASSLGLLHPAWRVAGVAASALAGIVLLLRPLTSLTVLAWAVPTALAAVAVLTIVAGDRLPRARRIGIALVFTALALTTAVLHAAVVTWIPVVLPGALAVWAIASATNSLSRRRIGAGVRAFLAGAAAAVWAVLAALWPDFGSIAGGVGFALLLLVLAVVVLFARPPGRRPARRSVRLAGVAVQWVGAVLAIVLAVGGASVAVHFGAGVPVPDDFYAWDEPLPDEPGVLLRQEPYGGRIPAGAEAVRILYTTTDASEQIVVASGVVAVPTVEVESSRTIVSWQHGTTGVARVCAPSLHGNALDPAQIPGIDRMAERGWIVVAPDYPGMGTDGSYPYLIGEGEGRSSLDGIRAAVQLEGVGVADEVMLMGHSQGGHATLWAADLAADYAPELDVVAVAALSSATDPLHLARLITAGGQSPIAMLATAYVVVPYAAYYDDIDLAPIVDPAARAIVEQLAARCATARGTVVAVLAAAAALAVDDRTLVRLDLDGGPVHDRLEQNIARASTSAPLFLGQGQADEVISIDLQRALADRLCADDRTVSVHEYPGRTHLGVIAPDSPLIEDLFAWVDEVDAGGSPTTCPGP